MNGLAVTVRLPDGPGVVVDFGAGDAPTVTEAGA